MRIAFTMIAVIMFSASASCRPYSDCVSIKVDAERLRCFDESSKTEGATGGIPVPPQEFRSIDLIDLKTDIKNMDGTKIEVSGSIMSFGGGLLLTKSSFDTSPIFIEIDAVPREQRRAVVEKCHGQCRAVLRGQVGEVMNQPGIIASYVGLKRQR